jgi:hypothetical protein
MPKKISGQRFIDEREVESRWAGMLAEQINKRILSLRHPCRWYVFMTAPWLLGSVFFQHESAVDSAGDKREKTLFGTLLAHEFANHNQ